MNTKRKFATVAMILAMAVMNSNSQMWADQQVRLRARANKVINGFETELRGDYREKNGSFRLNAQLEKINLPADTPVAFCLVHGGVKSLIGIGHVDGAVPEASIELESNDGDSVPKVAAGDLLQAHQRTKAPFDPTPACGSALLISAAFQK